MWTGARTECGSWDFWKPEGRGSLGWFSLEARSFPSAAWFQPEARGARGACFCFGSHFPIPSPGAFFPAGPRVPLSVEGGDSVLHPASPYPQPPPS